MSDSQNIIPDATNLYFALRNSGYSNTAAIADLIDNSIDAKASVIDVNIADSLEKIIITDNGTGMDMGTLKKALTLGGKKNHQSETDLGKYGLGLITASISMGNKITIITKKKGGDYNTGIFDCEKTIATNTFHADFYNSTDAEIVNFNKRTDNAKSGTVLIIDKCDKIFYKTKDELVSNLKKDIRVTFRAYMRTGKRIVIDGDELQYDDPLFLDHKDTKILYDQDITVKDNNGKSYKMHALVVSLPDFDQKTRTKLGINIFNQGFYFLRNSREIAPAIEIEELFKKHNNYNLFRAEINFGENLDDLMGVNYSKHNVIPSRIIISALKTALEKSVTTVRKAAEQRQKENREKKAGNPFTGTSVPAKATQSTLATSSSQSTNGVLAGQQNLFGAGAGVGAGVNKQSKEFETEISVRFKTASSPLFEASIDGDKILIRYNGANNYYKEEIIGHDYGVELKEKLDSYLTATVKSCQNIRLGAVQIVDILNGIAANLEA